MNNQSVRRTLAAICTFVLAVGLMVPIVAMASSYTSTLQFASNVTGATRSYVGANVHISATAHTQNGITRYFNVTLYRKNTITSSKIGTVKFTAAGSGTANSAVWTNVNSGNYYFDFLALNNSGGPNIISNNVKMYN